MSWNMTILWMVLREWNKYGGYNRQLHHTQGKGMLRKKPISGTFTRLISRRPISSAIWLMIVSSLISPTSTRKTLTSTLIRFSLEREFAYAYCLLLLMIAYFFVCWDLRRIDCLVFLSCKTCFSLLYCFDPLFLSNGQTNDFKPVRAGLSNRVF